MKEIKATKGFSFFVDDEDYTYLNSFLWYTKNTKTLNFYTEIPLTKVVELGLTNYVPKRKCALVKPDQLIVDYSIDTHFISFKNHDRNDFTKENLRVIPNKYKKLHRASPSKNQSMYRGVFKKRNSYAASIVYTDDLGETTKKFRYGFKTEEDAALAYNDLAKEYYGEYAYLNIIGKDSRKPQYLSKNTTIEHKRSLKVAQAEKGFQEHNGRFYVQQLKRSIANVENKADASLLYNLSAKQLYGELADVNELDPTTHEGEYVFFHNGFEFNNHQYINLWEACKSNNKDAFTLYQLVLRGESWGTAFVKAPYLNKDVNIKFNKYKYLHECWYNGVFEGLYETPEDAMFAYNKLAHKAVYELPKDFIGKPMVIGKNGTIVYKNKKYPSITAFSKDVGVSITLIGKYIDQYPIEDIVYVSKNGYSFMVDEVVEGRRIYSIKQFLHEFSMTRQTFNKLNLMLRKEKENVSFQDIYNSHIKTK